MKDEAAVAPDTHRIVAYSKSDAIKLDTKCLYAGKLEKIRQWHENPHEHPFCEILFVLAGRGEVIISGNKYSVKKGDIIIYNPHEIHEESTADSPGIELAFMGITNFKVCDLPIDHLIPADMPHVFSAEEDEENIRFYFSTLVEEVSDERQYNELIAKYCARLILIAILRRSNISETKFVTNAIFLRIHQYLNDNFAKIESMDQICSDLHISKYYLSHVFKKYMGRPPMQYVTAQRIAHAKKLLQQTDLTATEIGEICGYHDHVLFFKAFKKMEGITPIAFRRKTSGPGMVPRE